MLFLRGEPSLLELPCISVVGSRQPNERTRGFARRIGALAAKEGFVLCSGGAGGVDTEAEDACLGGGGRVIVFPAGRLTDCRVDARVLYLTEGAYDVPFSAQRALARNRLIHALGERTYAAQPRMQTGGTWRGCTDHLHSISRPLFVFDDGSEAARALLADGASPSACPKRSLRSRSRSCASTFESPPHSIKKPKGSRFAARLSVRFVSAPLHSKIEASLV